MKTRKLGNNGDYSFGANSFDYISGLDGIAQNIKTKVLLTLLSIAIIKNPSQK